MRFKMTKDGKCEVSARCPVCGEEKPLSHKFNNDELMKLLNYLEYHNGYIHDELNFLSPSDREQLLSGTCTDCYKEMCGFTA